MEITFSPEVVKYVNGIKKEKSPITQKN